MLKISAYVENCNACRKPMSKFQGVLKMFMLGVLKTILKTVLKYKKKHHHTLQHVLELSGRFRFSPSVLHA